MKSFVDLNGKMYPVNFGTWTLRCYERDTGKSINKFGTETETADMIDLFWHGLHQGADRANEKFELSKRDLTDLLDEDPKGMQDLANIWLESQGIPPLESEGTKKK